MNHSQHITMTLAGSTSFLLCLAGILLLGKRMKEKWKRNLLLLPIFFFLVPVYWFESAVVPWRRDVFQIHPHEKISNVRPLIRFATENGVPYVTPALALLVIVEVVMSITGIVLIGREIRKYWKLYQIIKICGSDPISQEEEAFFGRLQAQIGIRRKIRLYKSDRTEMAFSMGILHPVIVVPEAYFTEREQLRDILLHEMAHIRHGDTLLNFLVIVVVAVHWYNPLVYLYFTEVRAQFECYADETAVKGKNQEERTAYCQLLLEILRQQNRSTKNPYILCFEGSSSEEEEQESEKAMKRMKKRIKAIMKKKRVYRLPAVLLAIAVMGCGTITAFAYDPIPNVGEISQKAKPGDYDIFVPEEMIETEMKMLYDECFVDENGNVYPIEENKERAACKHTYVNGNYQKHKKSGAGCRMDYYHGKRCSKCGNLVMDAKPYSSRTWEKCPH